MVFNATFNNISVISWWSVLLVEYKNYVILYMYICFLTRQAPVSGSHESA
jgi:hypothetical protein